MLKKYQTNVHVEKACEKNRLYHFLPPSAQLPIHYHALYTTMNQGYLKGPYKKLFHPDIFQQPQFSHHRALQVFQSKSSFFHHIQT